MYSPNVSSWLSARLALSSCGVLIVNVKMLGDTQGGDDSFEPGDAGGDGGLCADWQ